MQQEFKAHHWTDRKGNPTGGSTTGCGFNISWQHGPLGRDEERVLPNGAFVEGVIAAVIDRLEFFQDSQFNCTYNKRALIKLKEALAELNARTKDREQRNVEGTHSE